MQPVPSNTVPAASQQSSRAPASVSPQPFTADPNAVSKLAAAPAAIGTLYTMRIPQGLARQQAKSTIPGAPEYLFTSAQHADGTKTVLIMTDKEVPIDDGSSISDDLELAIRSTLPTDPQEAKKFKESSIEHGTINGMPFARMHVTGVETLVATNQPFHESRVIYSGYDSANRRLILMMGVAPAPSSTWMIPEVEAAATTFARK